MGKAKKKISNISDVRGHISLKDLDKIGTKEDIAPISLRRANYVENTISTGSLSCDLIIGGGWPPGRWVTIYGPEASGKSTLLYHTLKQSIKLDILSDFLDFEGSLDPPYACNILEIKILDNAFGVKDQNNNWKVLPKCRYHQPDIGDPVFRYMHAVLKRLPDKLYRDEQWYLVFKNLPDGKKKAVYDKRLLKSTGKYWVPTEDGRIQMLWFIDSIPSMLPEARDEDSSKNPQAMLARMLSEYLPLVKGKLGRKRCSVIAANQIRVKPGVSFGNPEYEPCGHAIRHYSDLRLRTGGISVPHGTGMLEEEETWDGEGKDVYRYVRLKTPKNKVFVPFKQTVSRIWVSNKGKSGMGLDPFWDTYQFLQETGQISGTRVGFTLSIPGPWERRKWRWKELKELIMNPKKKLVAKKFRLKGKKRDIRKACWKQMQSGEAFDMYFKNL